VNAAGLARRAENDVVDHADGGGLAGTDGLDDEALPGGNMNRVIRRGSHVHRDAGPWTPTIHRLLDHLDQRGVTWLPQPAGMDGQGREVLTYLPGTVPAYPLPEWVWTEQILTTTTTARRLAQVHQAGIDFDTAGALWQLPAHHPAEVVCLNDVAPYNMVFDTDHQLTGWIDVDVASPGPRIWDLAYLAYRIVPLTGADDSGAGTPDLDRSHDRLATLCRAYTAASGVTIDPSAVLDTAVTRLGDLAEFTAARAAAGAHQVAHHAAIYRCDIDWIRQHTDQLS